VKLRVFRARLAELDLTEHVDYFATENPAIALRFIDAAEEAFERLAQNPKLRALQDFDHPALRTVRMWPIPAFAKHLIFYQITDEGGRVLRVLHGARDIAALLEPDTS
jgi:toxin ParE1/3/4